MPFPSLPYNSSPDETEGKPKVPQQEDGPKGRCQLGTSQGVGVHSAVAAAHTCDLCPVSQVWTSRVRAARRVRRRSPLRRTRKRRKTRRFRPHKRRNAGKVGEACKAGGDDG